jgi:ADP-ribose pyrophosphatase
MVPSAARSVSWRQFNPAAGKDTIEPFYQSEQDIDPMPQDITHYQGRYLSLKERNGWEFSTRANATGVVVIIAVTDDREIVLVEQYRPPVATRVIELPAGLVGDLDGGNESRLEAAGRELEEETGFTSADLSVVLEAPSSAGMTDEVITFVRARRLSRTGPGGGDDSEDIQVHLVPLDRVDSWLARQQSDGKPLDPKIFAALYWLSSGEPAPVESA